MSERGVYLTVFTLSVLVAAGGGFAMWWALQTSASSSLVMALGLAVVADALVGYKAWNAVRGVHPVEGDRVSLALKLLSVAIFLSLFGPRLWSIVRS